MPTITLLKQLKAHLAGKLQSQRVQRKPKPAISAADLIKQFDGAFVEFTPTTAQPPTWLVGLDRFASYREKIVPGLKASGYTYFLSCDSADYQVHQEWCNDHCQDHTLAHCDVWQVSSQYPRAFANKADALMFKLTFDATNIER